MHMFTIMKSTGFTCATFGRNGVQPSFVNYISEMGNIKFCKYVYVELLSSHK